MRRGKIRFKVQPPTRLDLEHLDALTNFNIIAPTLLQAVVHHSSPASLATLTIQPDLPLTLAARRQQILRVPFTVLKIVDRVARSLPLCSSTTKASRILHAAKDEADQPFIDLRLGVGDQNPEQWGFLASTLRSMITRRSQKVNLKFTMASYCIS